MNFNEIMLDRSKLLNIENLNNESQKYNLTDNLSKYKIKLHPHQLTLLQACINFENDKIYLKKYHLL